MEIPETQYNNIVNIITKYPNNPASSIFDKDFNENNLMSLLFSNSFLVNNAYIEYFLKYKYTNIYKNIIEKVIFYDYNFNKKSNLVPSTTKNIVDLDISYFNKPNIIKYYFFLEIISEIYGYIANNTIKNNTIKIKSRYIRDDTDNWVLYTKADYYTFDIKYEYNIDGISKYFILNISNNENPDIIVDMIRPFSNDIIKHLNYINKADIIQNSREYIFNIQAFYKFCRLKLIYYSLLCCKEYEKEGITYFIDKHLSYCFINLKNSILLKNVDNKSILLTNKLLTVTDNLKSASVAINSKNEKLKKNSKLSKIHDKNYIKETFYFVLVIASIFLISLFIIYNSDLKQYINFTSDIIIIVFIVTLYIAVIYVPKSYRREFFIQNIDANKYLESLYVKHPKINMTSNETTSGNITVRCKSSNTAQYWGDVYALFNGNKGDENTSSYHTNPNYNSNNGNAIQTYFPNYSGEVIMIDLGMPIILRQTKFFSRGEYYQRMPNIFRIYATNDITKFNNKDYSGWNLIHNEKNGNIIQHTYSEISYSSILNNDKIGQGNGQGILDSQQGWIASTNDLNQWMLFTLSENTEIIGIITQGRYNYSQWVTKYKISYSLDGINYTFLNGGAEINGNIDYNTYKYNFFTKITAKYVKIIPTGWYSQISMRIALIQYKTSFNIDNTIPYRNYALVVNKITGFDQWLNFSEWELYGLETPLLTSSKSIENGITVWDAANYTGAKSLLSVGSYDIGNMGIGGDIISSVKVPNGYKVTLYEHPNFQGRSLTLTQDEPNLINKNFNDITSSIKVELAGTSDNLPITLARNIDTTEEYYVSFTDPTKKYTMIVSNDIKCDILMVGGGGGGGFDSAGGGGGGQVLYYTDKKSNWKTDASIILKKGTYYITVGKGGNFATSINTVAGDGSASIIYIDNNNILLSADGGGGGGSKFKAGSKLTKGGGGGYGYTNGGIAENINTIKSGLNFKIYKGYFNDNLNFFNTNNSTNTGIISNIQDINKATNGIIPLNNSRDLYSVMWDGYFFATVTGKWTFYINSDDASYLWIGDVALSSYNVSNALINNGGIHGMQEKTATINLEKGKYYPIRIIFGENYGGDNMIFSWIEPNNTSRIYDGTGYFFLDNKPYSESNTNAGLGGYNSSETGGGGGGGANYDYKNGINGNNSIGPGNGGAGVDIDITGDKIGYGGGGAGGTYLGLKRALATHGGGSGGISTGQKPDNGIPNTGGGGGGGGHSSGNGNGGNGGSGIIIIRYPFNYDIFIKETTKNVLEKEEAEVKLAEENLKKAEETLKEKAKKEEENAKELERLKKEIEDYNKTLINEKLAPLDKEIAEKKKVLADKELQIKKDQDRINVAETDKARLDKNIKNEEKIKAQIKLAEAQLQKDVKNLGEIYNNIDRLKKEFANALQKYDTDMLKKQGEITTISLEKQNAEAKLTQAKIKEDSEKALILKEEGIQTKLANELSEYILQSERAKKRTEDAINLKKDLESKNDTASILMLKLANEELDRALADQKLKEQKQATEKARLKAEAETKTSVIRQKQAEDLKNQLNSMISEQESNVSNITQLGKDITSLSTNISDINKQTSDRLQIESDKYNRLYSEREQIISTLKNDIDNIKTNIDEITKNINTHIKNIADDRQRSIDIGKQLEQLAKDIANKTIELQQYKYIVKVLDIGIQSTDIGIKIAVNINNTATYIVNSIVLSSLIREHKQSLQQKEFIDTTEYKSNLDIEIKRRDDKIITASTNLIMNILLASTIIMIVNNKLRTSITSLIYILGIIYIILFIFYITEIIQIVKTRAKNKYWGKPNNI